ncbi:MAG TPA: hypothetical protein VJ370_20635 [Streptosporangiaceae bacterium]|jgi:hypothetical protein|nr:hypothetical protein [Streptosporangiaceae bacterium]
MRDQAALPRGQLVAWNVVPGTSPTARTANATRQDVASALPCLVRLSGCCPNCGS